MIACSTSAVNPPEESYGVGGTGVGGSTTGGASGSAATGGSSATGQGGSSAAGQGGASAMGGAGGSSAAGGTDTGSGGSTGGSSAAGGAGGSSAAGGTGGSATGGDAGMSASGGAGGSAAMSGMGGTDPGVCQHLSVIATPQIPTVELLVDTSSSMFETTPTAWSVLFTALMDPGTGVVKALQDQIRFGYASYKGKMASSETDAACATMTTVAPALNNYDAINTVYTQVGMSYNPSSPPSPKWETPTNYAITYAADVLTKYMPDPPGKKYILLVTDGNPNTCEQLDPQCGQDYAIKAAQDAFAADIGLFALGVGDIVANPNAGCPTSGRCGLNHLQDLANAGVGAGVMPPEGCDDPASTDCHFRYESCNKNSTLTATYTPAAPAVGTPFAVDTAKSDAQTKLTMALQSLLSNAVSCTFELDANVLGDASLGVVTLDGAPVTYNGADGWVLEADMYHVTLQGAACESYKAGKTLSIDFPCDPNGNPVAVHR